MKTSMLRITVLTIAVLFFFGLVGSPAAAYDEGQCKKYVTKLYKLVKPHKDVKFKPLLVSIGKIDDVEGGMEEDELEEHVEVPFEDIGWSKKFFKYMNKVEEYCKKDEE